MIRPAALCIAAAMPAAATTRFDFGDGSVDSNTGVAANVVVAENSALATVSATVDGIQVTLTGVAAQPGSQWGANSQGIGVRTAGEAGTDSAKRRIDGTIGESVGFRFSREVRIDSVRLGSHGSGDVTAIQFVSGTDPYGGGPPWSYASNGTEGPTDDIPVGVTIAAGTTMRLTTPGAAGGGVLWNDIAVSDPNAPVGDLVTTTVAEFPSPTLVDNPSAAPNPGFTTVAGGNAKGQSFSLGSQATVTGFVFGIDGVTSPGSFRLEVASAIDFLPWLDPVFSDGGNLPADLPAAGGLVRVDLAAPLTLSRGSWAVTLEGITADFRVALSDDPLFPQGALVRRNPSTGDRWALGTNVDADLVFAVLGSRESAPPPPAGRPNIIFILADDLGWTDVQAGPTGPNAIGPSNFGSDYYQTPNVARLAAEGLSFTHCYVQPNCAPTRAALLSGQYAPRSGNGVYVVDHLNRGDGTPNLVGPSQGEDVPAAHSTHAEALRAAGYLTAHFGKYHVGGHEGGASTLPENQGFELNFGGGNQGNPGSFYASGQVFAGNVGPGLDRWAGNYTQAYLDTILSGPPGNPLHQRAATPNNPRLILSDGSSNHGANKHLTDGIGDAAIAFLDDHRRGELRDHPFFMQFHFYAVHTPIQARWDLRQKYVGLPGGTHHSANQYAALVENMDQTVGRIIDRLDDPDGDGDTSDSISGDTLVIFTSDNGGHVGDTDNEPLRDRKGSFWEGGLRVPLIIRRPGTVPAGQATDTLVHAVDFYPTMLEHAGVPPPPGIILDGTSFAAHMLDPAGSPRDRGPIFYHFPGYLDNRARPCSVTIQRVDGTDFKLIYNYDRTYTGSNPPPEGLKVLDEPWELYNLSDDISETEDLLDGRYSNHLLYGAVADAMAAGLRAWLTQPGGDWHAKQPTYRSNGATVPYPPAGVPDVVVPPERSFRVTGADPDPAAARITLTWNSEAGFRYDVEGSDDMRAWDTLAAAVTASGPVTTRTVPDSAHGGSARRFYRIRLRP